MSPFDIVMYFLIAIIAGVSVGFLTVKLYNKIFNATLTKNAEKFSKGKLKNIYNYEGKSINVDKFKIRLDDNSEDDIKY